jgi:DNA-directed RNA polymerase subunit M/transcription elongation factor TFIIS
MSIHDLMHKYQIPVEWEQRVKESGVPYHNTMRRLFAGETLESALKVPQIDEKTTEVSEGVTQCGKCKSWKVLEMSMQTRSADEGATSFYACSECKYRWKV